MSDIVKNFYDNKPEKEWQRLEEPYAHMEFVCTMRLIEKYFPKAGKVCDIGGGPGRYSTELLKRKYHVILTDLSQECLNLAKKKFKENHLKEDGTICGDARDLSTLKDQSFDAVLLLGPLYHTIKPEDRHQILKNVYRILKHKGIAIVAYLNIWGILKCGLTDFPDMYANYSYLETFLGEKVFKKTVHGTFTESFWTTPPKAYKELEEAGFEILSHAGCESFLSGLKPMLDIMAKVQPVIYENLLKFAAETSELSQYRDATEHLHFVVRK